MVFNTHDGEEYVRQLRSLGAILAYPDPQRSQEYLFVRDLNQRPVVSRAEDIHKINFIYWVEKQPESVVALARTLGLPANLPYIVAFFPEETEKRLLELEVAFADKREEDIAETRFEIVLKGDTYEPKVLAQR
jgi:hypothetical protein